MPDTNKMIRDLVAQGFALPEGLEHRDGHWKLTQGMHGFRDLGGWHPIPDKQAHDLIACEFARERDSVNAPFARAMWSGDTEAAIKALWEGVCR